MTQHIELAALGVPDPDWDPLLHPKDKNGLFIKKGHGTYIFGKAKKAVFQTKAGVADHEITLLPGDKLVKSTATTNAIWVKAQKGASPVLLSYSGPTHTYTDPKQLAIPSNSGYKALHGEFPTVAEAPGIEVPGNSLEEAQANLEKMAEIYQKALAIKDANGAAPVSIVKDSMLPNGFWVTPSDKVYVHPQGAYVVVTDYGSMTAFGANGKKKQTSATPEKLAAGHGKWALDPGEQPVQLPVQTPDPWAIEATPGKPKIAHSSILSPPPPADAHWLAGILPNGVLVPKGWKVYVSQAGVGHYITVEPNDGAVSQAYNGLTGKEIPLGSVTAEKLANATYANGVFALDPAVSLLEPTAVESLSTKVSAIPTKKAAAKKIAHKTKESAQAQIAAIKDLLAPMQTAPAVAAILHPKTGEPIVVPEGATLYQHKLTPTSFLIVNEDGGATKIDSAGKYVSGAKMLKYLKNYKVIQEPAPKAPEAPAPVYDATGSKIDLKPGDELWEHKLTAKSYLITHADGTATKVDTAGKHKNGNNIKAKYLGNYTSVAAWPEAATGAAPAPVITPAVVTAPKVEPKPKVGHPWAKDEMDAAIQNGAAQPWDYTPAELDVMMPNGTLLVDGSFTYVKVEGGWVSKDTPDQVPWLAAGLISKVDLEKMHFAVAEKPAVTVTQPLSDVPYFKQSGTTFPLEPGQSAWRNANYASGPVGIFEGETFVGIYPAGSGTKFMAAPLLTPGEQEAWPNLKSGGGLKNVTENPPEAAWSAEVQEKFVAYGGTEIVLQPGKSAYYQPGAASSTDKVGLFKDNEFHGYFLGNAEHEWLGLDDIGPIAKANWQTLKNDDSLIKISTPVTQLSSVTPAPEPAKPKKSIAKPGKKKGSAADTQVVWAGQTHDLSVGESAYEVNGDLWIAGPMGARAIRADGTWGQGSSAVTLAKLKKNQDSVLVASAELLDFGNLQIEGASALTPYAGTAAGAHTFASMYEASQYYYRLVNGIGHKGSYDFNSVTTAYGYYNDTDPVNYDGLSSDEFRQQAIDGLESFRQFRKSTAWKTLPTGDKSKVTRFQNQMEFMLRVSNVARALKANEPVPEQDLAGWADRQDKIWKGTGNYIGNTGLVNRVFTKAQEDQTRRRGLAAGLELPEGWKPDTVLSSEVQDQVIDLANKVGFEHAAGLRGTLASFWIHAYLSGNFEGAVHITKQAKDLIETHKAKIAYAAWKDKQPILATTPYAKDLATLKAEQAEAKKLFGALPTSFKKGDTLYTWNPTYDSYHAPDSSYQGALVLSWVSKNLQHNTLGLVVIDATPIDTKIKALSNITQLDTLDNIKTAMANSGFVQQYAKSDEARKEWAGWAASGNQLGLWAWGSSDSYSNEAVGTSGSPTSPEGSLAYHALSDIIALSAYPELLGENPLKVWDEQDETGMEDIAELVNITGFIDKNEGFKAWVSLVHSKLPDPHDTPPIQDAYTNVTLTKPAGTSDEAWALIWSVLQEKKLPAMSATTATLGQLKILKPELKFGLQSPMLAKFPDELRPLLDWAYFQPTGATHTKSIKEQVAEAIKVLATEGVWAVPGAQPVEVVSNGIQQFILVKPGDTVYKYAQAGGVTIAHTDGTFETLQNGTWTAGQPYAGYQGEILHEEPNILTYTTSGPELGVSEEDWNTFEENQGKKWDAISLPVSGTKGDALIFLKKSLASDPDATELSGHLSELPEGVLKLLYYAHGAGDHDIVKIANLKYANKQFSLQKKPLISPHAPYASLVAAGQTSYEQIESWPTSKQDAAAVDLLGLQAIGVYTTAYEPNIHALADLFLGQQPSHTPAPPKSGPNLILTKITKKASGMHEKHFWADQHGTEWMTKLFPHEAPKVSQARIDTETYANQIGVLFGFGSPETHSVRLPASGGQVQPGTAPDEAGTYSYLQLFADSPSDLVGKQAKDLNDVQLFEAMASHVLDWVVSNHDTHHENLRLKPDGAGVFEIDLGQAFKFFGQDKLAVGYLPPGNGVEVWYDRVYKEIRTGKLDKTRADELVKFVLKRALSVEMRHDDEYRAMLELALSKRTTWPKNFPTKDKFIGGLMARKTGIFADFETLYQSLYTQAGWGDLPVTRDDLIPKKVGGAHTSITAEFVAEVPKAGSVGLGLFFGGPELEDVHFQIHQTLTADGKVTLRGETKLRAEADMVLSNWLKTQTVDTTAAAPASTPTPIVQLPNHKIMPGLDEVFNALKAESITVSHHAKDNTEPNAGTMSDAAEKMAGLKAAVAEVKKQSAAHPAKPVEITQMYPGGTMQGLKFVTTEQQNAWLKHADYYLSAHEKVLEAAKQKLSLSKLFPDDVPFEQQTYTPTAGIDVSGHPKIMEQFKISATAVSNVPDTAGTLMMSKWSDGNFTQGSDTGLVQIDAPTWTALHSTEGAVPKYNEDIKYPPGTKQTAITTKDQLDALPIGAQVQTVPEFGEPVVFTKLGMASGTMSKVWGFGKNNGLHSSSTTMMNPTGHSDPMNPTGHSDPFELVIQPEPAKVWKAGDAPITFQELDDMPEGTIVQFPGPDGDMEQYVMGPNGLWQVAGASGPDETFYSSSDAFDPLGIDQLADQISVLSTPGEDAAAEADADVTVTAGTKVVSVKYRKGNTYAGTFDEKTGQVTETGGAGGSEIIAGKEYEIVFDNVTIQYQSWHEGNVPASQQGFLRFAVKNWNGSESQLESVFQTLRATGLELPEADEQQMELFYWRHMFGVLKERNDRTSAKYAPVLAKIVADFNANPDPTPEQELINLRAAWALAFGQKVVDRVVAKEEYVPQFGHQRHDGPEEMGQPRWGRPDSDFEEMKAHVNGKLPTSRIYDPQTHTMSIIKSGMLASTEERPRLLGKWVHGTSSSQDKNNHGSSNVLYFHPTSSMGNGGTVTMEPHVMSRVSNYVNASDSYGDIKRRKNDAPFDLKKQSHGYELMIKYDLAVLTDVAFITFPSEQMRQEAIDYYKSIGITEIRGLPVSERFVYGAAAGNATAAKVWAMAIKKQKEARA